MPKSADQIDWSFLVKIINTNFSHLKDLNILESFLNEFNGLNFKFDFSASQEIECTKNVNQEWKKVPFVGISNWVLIN